MLLHRKVRKGHLNCEQVKRTPNIIFICSRALTMILPNYKNKDQSDRIKVSMLSLASLGFRQYNKIGRNKTFLMIKVCHMAGNNLV